MLTHLDWCSLTAAGPYLMLTGLFCCPVSTANCPTPSPVANWLLCVPLFNPSLAFPCLFPVVSRSWAKAFVWFRAKTDKGIVCLADHPHSVTPWSSLATHPYRSSFPACPQDYTPIHTELLYVGSSWSPCFRSAMWRGP